MRRPLAVLAVALGVGLIAVPIATSLWSRTDGAENTFDVMRDFVSEPGIALARQNFGTVNAGGTEFLEKGVPFLDAQNVDLARYPDIAAGAEKIPGYLSFVGPTIDALDANREEFADADSLVGLGLPITAAPWLLVLLGAGFAGAGVLTLRRPGRAGPIAALALAVAAVAVPVALAIPDKAGDARAVGDIARGGLSKQGADTAEEIVVVLDRMVAQVKGDLIPDLAQRLDTTPEQVAATLGRELPATTTFLNRWESISAGPTGASLAAKQQSVVEDFAKADETPVLELPWLVIGPGALLLVVAGAALLGERGQVARTRALRAEASASTVIR